ncbi:hypothetical protein Calkro_1311 [Caldicellulosiruptor kronotskyensis 2002]|uniref:Uncharacterized protein n=1 Tax=Caldicellulosiruptor kronotskyensis (strain DSM 18902 / VKM B-2412 / 2002) TaxID=632348 RepID=E4SBP8_CALK2|nr:hypothetical protein Calkro_1311 [Caldicellulosiruptor kronotskyensis 2002]
MLFKSILKCFAYCFGASAGVGLFVLIVAKLNDLYVKPEIILVFGLMIFLCSLTMAIIFGYLCDHEVYVYKKGTISENELEERIKRTGYYTKIEKDANKIIATTPHKLTNWLCGKIIIEVNEDEIRIDASRGFLYKYFRPVKMH